MYSVDVCRREWSPKDCGAIGMAKGGNRWDVRLEDGDVEVRKGVSRGVGCDRMGHIELPNSVKIGGMKIDGINGVIEKSPKTIFPEEDGRELDVAKRRDEKSDNDDDENDDRRDRNDHRGLSRAHRRDSSAGGGVEARWWTAAEERFEMAGRTGQLEGLTRRPPRGNQTIAIDADCLDNIDNDSNNLDSTEINKKASFEDVVDVIHVTRQTAEERSQRVEPTSRHLPSPRREESMSDVAPDPVSERMKETSLKEVDDTFLAKLAQDGGERETSLTTVQTNQPTSTARPRPLSMPRPATSTSHPSTTPHPSTTSTQPSPSARPHRSSTPFNLQSPFLAHHSSYATNPALSTPYHPSPPPVTILSPPPSASSPTSSSPSPSSASITFQHQTSSSSSSSFHRHLLFIPHIDDENEALTFLNEVIKDIYPIADTYHLDTHSV